MCRQPYVYLESAYKGNLQSQMTAHEKMQALYRCPAPQEMVNNFAFINTFIEKQQEDAFIESVLNVTPPASSASSSSSSYAIQEHHRLPEEYITKWLTFQPQKKR